MKTTTTLKFLTVSLAACLLVGLTACKTTRQTSLGVEPSGFLGDYSQLQTGVKDRAVMSYVKPGVNWNKYTKIWIKPVELWKSDDPEAPMGKISAENQQTLIDLFHTSMSDTLQQSYQLVTAGGPDVLVIHAALTDARKSKPAANFVSSVYLPLKVVSFAKQSITGTGIGVGSVTIEAELLDGQSNERLAAAVDRRAGTKALSTKFNSTWGDVKLSFDWWAQRLNTRLMEEKAGSVTKTAL